MLIETLLPDIERLGVATAAVTSLETLYEWISREVISSDPVSLGGGSEGLDARVRFALNTDDSWALGDRLSRCDSPPESLAGPSA